jgi:ATP-dependent DNA helicase RecQ
MMEHAKKILKTRFGYEDFRLDQEEIIKNILEKENTVVIMPTGGGKSLCYQIPAMLFNGLTLVISPLISLMKDQVDQIRQIGVSAVYLNSTLAEGEYESTIDQIKSGTVKLLYLAPETLFIDRILNLINEIKIDCLAIDEAHCISDWGHDFRPEYRKLITIKNLLADAVTIALTATATEHVRNDIKKQLGISDSNEFISSFNRTNLFLNVIPKKDPTHQVIHFLEKYKDQSGIIYCFSRKQVDELSATLNNNGYSTKPYHAGLKEEERSRNQELFIKDDIQIIVATIAFGMGINKPNVRFVIHHDLPKNIESYYQEIGRAGRDGLDAECILLYSYGDSQKINYFIQQKDEQEKKIASFQLNTLIAYAETDLCRRIPLLNYFGEEYLGDCENCDVCNSEPIEMVDITVHSQKFMSCMKRSGERFGVNHIIDILRGSASQKIEKFDHDKLSTYGIGKELSKKQWQYISRQLLQKKYIQQNLEHGNLEILPKSFPVLKGEEKILGRLIEKETLTKDSKIESVNYDRDLYELLRSKRKALADEQNVPPYVIFSDKSIIEMANHYPQSEETFIQIHGVGDSKLKKYGSDFISIIKSYCNEKGIEEKPKAALKRTVIKSGKSKRYEKVAEMFNNGKSVDDLANELSVKEDTVIEHIYKFLLDGNEIKQKAPVSHLELNDNQYNRLIESFKKHGYERLKPIFEDLAETFSYSELRYLRLHFLLENEP